MPYCTLDDIRRAAGGLKALTDLSDQEGTGQVDEEVVSAAQAAAEGRIDGLLRPRFATPIPAPIPAKLVQLAARETVYELLDMRGMLNEDAKHSHKERMDDLKLIGEGKSALGPEPGPGPSSSVKARWADRSADEPISRESLKGVLT